jgi:hypothetical protein
MVLVGALRWGAVVPIGWGVWRVTVWLVEQSDNARLPQFHCYLRFDLDPGQLAFFRCSSQMT